MHAYFEFFNMTNKTDVLSEACLISIIQRFQIAAWLAVIAQPAVLAQSAQEAARELNDIQAGDPQGFTWMLICIGMIMTAAITLITVTTVYAMKGKKRA